MMTSADEMSAIGLSRGMCYGPCPVYSLSFDRTGAAQFTGTYFVTLVGPHVARCQPDEFADLARAMVFPGFESLGEAYSIDVTDQADASTWIVRDCDRHAVSDYGAAGPLALAAIQELIDGLAATLDWQPEPVREHDGGDASDFDSIALNSEMVAMLANDPETHWTQRQR